MLYQDKTLRFSAHDEVYNPIVTPKRTFDLGPKVDSTNLGQSIQPTNCQSERMMLQRAITLPLDKMLREIDPAHDVYVGPVGSWMPFHPEAYKTGRVEYMEEELNQLMHEKDKNEKQASVEFEKRVKESKKKDKKRGIT